MSGAQITPQMRAIAQGIAAAHPIETGKLGAIASGNALAAQNDEPEPARYVRTPELDKRIARGDINNGNAWREVATGKTRYFLRGYDAAAGRWLALDDPRRAQIDGSQA